MFFLFFGQLKVMPYKLDSEMDIMFSMSVWTS